MSAPWWLVGLLVGVVALLLLYVRSLAQRGSQRSKARNQRAQRGESAAEQLLQDEGYTVIERQVRGAWTLWVNGEPLEVEVRADLLVERDGERFIAEVKTGELAPDPSYPPTRRQLLEYSVAFDVDGLLLVDMEAGEILEIEVSGQLDPG